MGYLEDSTLLAFKPFLYNMRVRTLHPQTLPYYVWPAHRVITSPCQFHKEPEEGCTCGVYSTYDLDIAQEYSSCHYELEISELVPILGVVQVLGKTIDTDMTLRSWGAYLWGIVKPLKMEIDVFEKGVIIPLWNLGFRPVEYYELEDAWRQVRYTLRNYDLA